MTAKKATPPGQPGRFRRMLAWLASDGPIYALILIAFGGSLGHGVEVAHKYGQHAAEGWFIAAAVDLFCYVAAKERKRDKSINRNRRGIASMPTIALVIGVALTLAINLKTAVPNAWGYVIAGIPGGLLLIVIALLERREGFEAKISERSEAPQNEAARAGQNAEAPASQNAAVPAQRSEVTVPANAPPSPQNGSAARPVATPDTRAATAFRSEGSLQEEALRILAEYKAATGERMPTAELAKAMHVAKQRAVTVRSEVKDREEAA